MPEEIKTAKIDVLTVDVASYAERRTITFHVALSFTMGETPVGLVVHFVCTKTYAPPKAEFILRADIGFTAKIKGSPHRVWFTGDIARSSAGWACTAAWEDLGTGFTVRDLATALAGEDTDISPLADYIPALTGATLTYEFRTKAFGVAFTGGGAEVFSITRPPTWPPSKPQP